MTFTSSDNLCALSNYFFAFRNMLQFLKFAGLNNMLIWAWWKLAGGSLQQHRLTPATLPALTSFWAGTSKHCFMRVQYVHVCLQFSLGEGIVNPPLKVTTWSGTNTSRAIGTCPPNVECWAPSTGRLQTAIQALQLLLNSFGSGHLPV